MSYKEFFNKYSENIGGGISFAGSLIPAATGDIHSIAAAGMFALSEITFLKKGNTSAGYSIGAIGFASGDLTLAFSEAVAGNQNLKMALIAMATVWGAGVLRYPLNQIGRFKESDFVQNAVGVSCLSLRIPGFIAAAAAHNYPVMAAIGLWGTADILCGRLQNNIQPVLQKIGIWKGPQ